MSRPAASSGSDVVQGLRSDATRNRQRILDAAAQAFAEHGTDVGYDEIARLAGVGVGTVYRRFPERADLVAALFASRVDDVLAVAAEAAALPDAWSGFCLFLERVTALQAADRGLRQVFADDSSFQHERLREIRTRLMPPLESLVDRAQTQGTLRRDVDPADIPVLMKLVSAAGTPSHPDLWRRYLAIVVDGLAESRSGSLSRVGLPPKSAPTATNGPASAEA